MKKEKLIEQIGKKKIYTMKGVVQGVDTTGMASPKIVGAVQRLLEKLTEGIYK